MSRASTSQSAQPAGGAAACIRCGQLQGELEATQSALRAAQAQAAELRAQLANLQRSTFGRKSEAVAADGDDPAPRTAAADGTLADPATAQDPPGCEPQTVSPARRQRGRQPGSPTPPREQRPDVPVVRERLDVPAAERRCPDCGTGYLRSGHKLSSVYEIVVSVRERKLVRQRYGPACDCGAARPVIAPPAPRLGTSQLGPSVWAWCLVQVYALFRPQAAVARDLEHLGLRVPTATLSAGLRRLAHLFAPLDAAIEAYQRQQPVLQADETSWPVQWIAASEDGNKDPPARGRQKPKFWLWACLAGRTVRMRILPTRGLDAARELLAAVVGTSRSLVLVCDCYSTYKAFARLFPGRVVLAHCWAHVRRKFVQAGTGHAALNAWTQEWVERISALFELNRQRLRHWDRQQPLSGQSAAFQAVQRRLHARLESVFRLAAEQARELSFEWMRLDRADPGRHGAELARVEAQGRALGTLLRHREALSRFVADPRIPMDNNFSERILRGPAIARYTCFGSGGPDGARAAGLLFGVLATVRLAGLNPYAWMLDWLAACARHGGQPPPQLEPWLPWRMSATRRAQLSRTPADWMPSAAVDKAA